MPYQLWYQFCSYDFYVHMTSVFLLSRLRFPWLLFQLPISKFVIWYFFYCPNFLFQFFHLNLVELTPNPTLVISLKYLSNLSRKKGLTMWWMDVVELTTQRTYHITIDSDMEPSLYTLWYYKPSTLLPRNLCKKPSEDDIFNLSPYCVEVTML